MKYNRINNMWLTKGALIAKVQFVFYFSTGTAAIIYPLVVYLQRHERVYYLMVFVPFFDRKTLTGFWFNQLYQIFLAILTTFNCYAIDMLFIILLFTGANFIDLMRSDVADLSVELLKKGKNRDEKKISDMLTKILTKGQTIDEYASVMDFRFLIIFSI